ncbi:MAG: histone deacetylase [Gemmatimonadota bacterium]|nr:MAG: histone deacetylase [Gemmatimonadota bacterium]
MTQLAVVHHEAYEVDIGPHVFPTLKYRLVLDQVLADGTISRDDLVRPEPASDDDVGLVHTPEYVGKLSKGTLSVTEQLVLEVPFSVELRDAMWLCAGGSILAGKIALDHGLAFHLGGGFHHAFPDHGEGFCLINDVAIAIQALRRDGFIESAVVIDCDVHHGNGTAAIFSGEADVFTFSMHQQHNYPAWKPPSDLDLGLEDGTGDAEYLSALEHHVPRIIDAHQPDLAFYLAGADPYEQDQLGGLRLTKEGLRRRDAAVLDSLCRAKVPTVVTLAGGYAQHQDDTVEIHANTLREAKRVVAAW